MEVLIKNWSEIGTVIKKDYSRLLELEIQFKLVAGISIEDLSKEILAGTAKIEYSYPIMPKLKNVIKALEELSREERKQGNIKEFVERNKRKVKR